MLGTTLLFIGVVGLAGKALQTFFREPAPPERLHATVVKTRLDTKKADGIETYTYILTFFIPQKNRYLSLNVSQKQFDETMANDSGILTCNLDERKFILWEIDKPS